jgi:hypothetical protein
VTLPEEPIMSAKGERAGGLLSSGTFWIALGFFLAAPIMNLGYDRMSKTRLSGDGSEILPSFFVTLYNTGGKMAVSLFLVAVGVTILIVGQLWQGLRRRPVEAFGSTADLLPQSPRDSSVEEPAPVTAVSGRVVLQTQKYLS